MLVYLLSYGTCRSDLVHSEENLKNYEPDLLLAHQTLMGCHGPSASDTMNKGTISRLEETRQAVH